MENLLAQKLDIYGQEIEGPLKGIGNIADVINVIIKLVYPSAGVLLLIYLIWGGFEYMSSGGEPEKVTNAQNKIKYAIIGVTLLAFSFLIVRIATYILGFGEGVI